MNCGAFTRWRRGEKGRSGGAWGILVVAGNIEFHLGHIELRVSVSPRGDAK